MLKIRLQRVGRKHDPVFRVVLTDSKNGPKSGKFNEILGSYDARDKNVTKFDAERIKQLIKDGAQVSDTMHNLLVGQKVIDGKKINVLPKKSPVVDEAKLKAEAEAKAKAEADAKAKAEAEEAAKNAPVVEVTEEAAPVAEAEAPVEAPVAETAPVADEAAASAEVAEPETEAPAEETPTA